MYWELKRRKALVVGRITKDAVVNQLKDERQVINFTLAINDYYKPRNGEGKYIATYINCSYWMNPKLAERITKGTLVEATGRIYVNREQAPYKRIAAIFVCLQTNNPCSF